MSNQKAIFVYFLLCQVSVSALLKYKCDPKLERDHEIGYIKREYVLLDVHPISTKEVTSEMQCLHTCDMNCECASVNIKNVSCASKTLTCEILDTAVTHHKKPMLFSNNYKKEYEPKSCRGCRSFTTSVGDLCDCTKTSSFEESCEAHRKLGQRRSGLYLIRPLKDIFPFIVFCQMAARGWTVIQRRIDGSINFNRTWHEYKDGFGHMTTEFWMGNDILHKMTSSSQYDMKVYLSRNGKNTDSTGYRSFRLESETSYYALYKEWKEDESSPAGDALAQSTYAPFRTWDSDDSWSTLQYGGWWLSNMTSSLESNLNGKYYSNNPCPRRNGIIWSTWEKYNTSCPVFVFMCVRPS